MPAHRQPRAHRRHRQRQPEEKLRVVGEPFRQRIETDDQQRHRRQREAQRVDKPRRRHERRRAPVSNAMAAGRETSRCRPAVRGFRLSISQSAKRLKVIAAVRAQHHAQEDQPERPPARPPARGGEHRAQREGQREDRVRKADKRQRAVYRQEKRRQSTRARGIGNIGAAAGGRRHARARSVLALQRTLAGRQPVGGPASAGGFPAGGGSLASVGFRGAGAELSPAFIRRPRPARRAAESPVCGARQR